MAYTWDFNRPARQPEPMLLANSWTDPLNPAFSNGRFFSLRQITVSFTIVHGKHTLKGGFDWRFTREWRSKDGIRPNVSFAAANGSIPTVGPAGAAVISSPDRRTFEKLYNDLLGRMNLVSRTFYSDLEKFQPVGTPACAPTRTVNTATSSRTTGGSSREPGRNRAARP